MTPTRLETVQSVIERLYGNGADMARALDRSRTAIWKYQKRNMLPGGLYFVLQDKARLSDCEIADELFTSVVVHPSLVARNGV